jgi:hypothetical protein
MLFRFFKDNALKSLAFKLGFSFRTSLLSLSSYLHLLGISSRISFIRYHVIYICWVFWVDQIKMQKLLATFSQNCVNYK